MKPGKEIPTLEGVIECLGVIWLPAVEATRLREGLGVRSLEETATAAEQAGCEVCFADLPEKVSGFAEIIGGRPHIVLNRTKSPNHLKYTLPHELGHQVLHLNLSSRSSQSRLPNLGAEEFQAHLFATTWIIALGNDEQREEVLQANPISFVITITSLFFSILVVVIALAMHIYSKLLPTQQAALPEPK